MQSRRHYSFPQTVWWSFRFLTGSLLYASSVVGAYVLLGRPEIMVVPFSVVSMLGVVVAFFVGFKNNSSYDRLWEARKIWGAIVNVSRSWAITVQGFVTDEFVEREVDDGEVRALHRDLVMRHVAWLAALRHHLRRRQTWEHTGRSDDMYIRSLCHECKTPMESDMALFIEQSEVDQVSARTNRATHLLANQSHRLRDLKRQGFIDNWRHMELQKLLHKMFDEQGKSERIKNFPFPRQYASFTLYSVWILSSVLPFGLIDVFTGMAVGYIWMAVPCAAIVTWLFFTAELIGDYSENPFEGLWNDVPITSLSRTIEIDLKELIDEAEIPAAIGPGELGLVN